MKLGASRVRELLGGAAAMAVQIVLSNLFSASTPVLASDRTGLKFQSRACSFGDQSRGTEPNLSASATRSKEEAKLQDKLMPNP